MRPGGFGSVRGGLGGVKGELGGSGRGYEKGMEEGG